MARTLKTGHIPIDRCPIPSGSLVLTPHRAAAEHLGEPHVSLRSVAERILRRENIGVASHLTALHALKAAIKRTAPKLDPAAEAERLSQILRTVLRIGIDLSSLRQHGSPRARFLADVAEIYVDSLAKIGLIDREAVLWRASQLELERERLFVYGYFRARKEEILFIDRFAADESVFFLPCHENSIFEVNRTWAHTLTGLGWTIDPANDLTTNDISPGTAMASRFINVGLDKDSLQDRGNAGTAIAYPSIEAEVRGTIARAKHLVIEGVRPEKIAIVCRTVQPYASLIASVSREYGLPVEMKHMIPVGQTPVGEFVKLLLGSIGPEAESKGDETVDRPLDFEATARMLLHPLGPGITDDKWPDARRSHPSSIDDWQKLGTDLAILQVPERQSFKEWAGWLSSVFTNFRVREKAGSGAAELTALNRLIEAIDEQTGRQAARILSFESFAAEIFDILSMVSTPFGTSRGGVVLHQPNTVIGGKFDHIFVLGMAEGMLPAKVTENPIIDFHERKRLSGFGIEFEDAAEVPRWESLSFYFVLLAGAKSLIFSYPRYVDGDPRLPNSYFEKLGLSPEEAAEEFVSSREELRRVYLAGARSPITDEVLERAKFQFAVERRRESSEPFDEFDGVVGKALDPSRRTWSVSQLTKIGQCPFKWFSEKVLGLGPPEEADLELPPATKGTLYHKTLEIAVQNAIAADDLRAAVLANLDAAFAEAEASDGLLVASVANWELQRSEHLELLRKAVRSSSFIAEGARVLAVEQEFNTVWMDLPIRGRIDRIDDGPEGLMTIDYKTGSYTGKVKDDAGRLKIDLQIAVYSQAALPYLYPGKKVGTGKYLRLAKRKAEAGKDVPLDRVVASVKETMLSGRFTVEPDVDGEACKYCSFDPVCRQGPRLELKRSGK